MNSFQDFLLVKNFSIGYDSVPILDDINIRIDAGKIVGIIGKNGSGKTTLLNSIVGVSNPLNGFVYYINNEITDTSVIKRVRDFKFGYLLQNNRVILDLTVKENLHVSQRSILNWSKREKNIEELLKIKPFDKLESYLNKDANVLSGGEQLLLAFASLKLQNSNIILLDEPSSGLDVENKAMIIEHLKRFKEEKKIVLLIEQSLKIVFDVSDEIYVIKSNNSGNRNVLVKMNTKEKIEIRNRLASETFFSNEATTEIINFIWD